MTDSYRLGDADRERLGGPEWLPFELMDVTLGQVTELSDRFGFELEDWPDVLTGTEARKAPKWRLQCLVWLALYQSGVNVPWEDAGTVAALRVTFRADEGPGKDESSSESPPSPTPETSTTPPSSTSSPDSAEES